MPENENKTEDRVEKPAETTQETESQLREKIERNRARIVKERVEYLAKFTGGEVTGDKITAWKREHGDVETWKHKDVLYIYRSVKRKEFSNIQEKNPDPAEQEIELVARCLLYPAVKREQLQMGPAMIPTNLAGKILVLSGAVSQADEDTVTL